MLQGNIPKEILSRSPNATYRLATVCETIRRLGRVAVVMPTQRSSGPSSRAWPLLGALGPLVLPLSVPVSGQRRNHLQ